MFEELKTNCDDEAYGFSEARSFGMCDTEFFLLEHLSSQDQIRDSKTQVKSTSTFRALPGVSIRKIIPATRYTQTSIDWQGGLIISFRQLWVFTTEFLKEFDETTTVAEGCRSENA